ncbi:MAG: isopentenyl-diphosphate Delta-isomerase [Saprospiraceae bacterium]|nr:isopentenyl-diphosphate Delta-isomerase [Pyrinomonadaceae bacterium]
MLIILAVGAYFMTNVELPRGSHYVSAINVLLFALPSYWAVKMWLGWRDGVLLIAVLGVYALLIETAAIITGFPYGHFGYSEHLGFKLFGLVPWTVAFAWPPLMLAAYAVAYHLVADRLLHILFVTLLLTIFDLVLDPGAVELGFWSYPDGGAYYGVPLSNFAGWLVSGFIGSVIFAAFAANKKPLLPAPVQLTASAVFIIFFWTALSVFAALIAPALIGVSVFVGLLIFNRKFYFAFDEMIVLVDDDNNPLATRLKSEVHDGDTKLHRAFSAFLFNSEGELLLQQRAFTKKTWPGVWSNSCCGHTMLHETTENAGIRRIAYELGLRNTKLTVALPDFRYRAEKDGIVENEICPVLIGFTDRIPKPNPDEVAGIKWVDWEAFLLSLKQPETEISPWAIEEVELLAQSANFKTAYKANTNK